MNLGRASWHENFVGDGTSSHAGESSHTSFPELRQLPNNARLPIRDFLLGQLSKSHGEKDGSRRKWLLAEAAKELDDDVEIANVSAVNSGLYDTILHTACLVGSLWLVKLQIEAGVDVSALNRISWTALMVAIAQGHTSCADLLSEHMKTRMVKVVAQAFLPSGFGNLTLWQSLSIGKDNLTAVANSLCSFTSDYPIPPRSQAFYYEIKTLPEMKDSEWVQRQCYRTSLYS